MNINSNRIEELVQQLARITGEDAETALERAIEERLSLVAAIANEPDCTRYQEAIIGAASLAMSAVTVFETRIVLHSRHGTELVRTFNEATGKLRHCRRAVRRTAGVSRV